MRVSFKSFRINIPSAFIIITFLINILLSKLPLTSTLGYEFAAVNGILLFFFGGILSIHQLKKTLNKRSFVNLIHENRFSLAISALIPFVIGLISSIFFGECPIIDGIWFYLVIAVSSLFFGTMLGFFSNAITGKFTYLFYTILFFTIILSPLIELYRNPQIYFYNTIFGYFPGTIYDEDITVDHFLIAYRIFNLAFFIGLVFVSEKINCKKFVVKLSACSIIFLIIILFSALEPVLKLSTDTRRLNSELNKEVFTENFRIHFFDTANKSEIEFGALLHEYYLDQDKTSLNHYSKMKIDSYIFRDRNQKRELFGAGNADVAKPWLSQVYLNMTNYDATLKHELLHTLAADFGTTPFKVAGNINPAMIEGIAVAFENNFDGYPVHYMAKLAEESGYKFPIEKLFGGLNFFTKTSSISYIYAGSFIKYLADRYGVSIIKKLYSDTNFEKYFSKNISTLVIEYEDFLKNYQIEFNKNQAQLYFGGQTIFKKFCPRMAASDVKRAWNNFNSKKNNEALQLFQKVYHYSNSYQSLTGILACLSNEKKYLEAEKLLSKEISNFRTSQYYFYLELLLGDLFIQSNQPTAASAYYDSLLTQQPHIEYTNEVLIRKMILSEGADSLRSYFDKTETQKFEKLMRMNENGINYFSVGKILRLAKESSNLNVNFSKLFREKIKVNDNISRYSALQLSMFFLRKFDYDEAQFFAIKTMDYKENENTDYGYIENLRMVNWFKNNANETKSKFRYQ